MGRELESADGPGVDLEGGNSRLDLVVTILLVLVGRLSFDRLACVEEAEIAYLVSSKDECLVFSGMEAQAIDPLGCDLDTIGLSTLP